MQRKRTTSGNSGKTAIWSGSRLGKVTRLILCGLLLGLSPDLAAQKATDQLAQEPYAVQASRSVYEAILLGYERLEKLSGDFGDKPQFTGRFQALLEDDNIRAVIVQFDEEREGDWHEYYFHDSTLRYAFTRSLNSEGLPANHRYFLDSQGNLQRLDINSRTVARAEDASAAQAGREISRLARQFYAIARVEMLERHEDFDAVPKAVALEDPATLNTADLTGGSTGIPRAVPVAEAIEPAPEGILVADASAPDSLSPQTSDLTQATLSAAAEQQTPTDPENFSAESADTLAAMQLSLISRWAEWSNRTRADKARRTPLPPDLLLDLSTPDPEAGGDTGALVDAEAEKAALDAFLSSAVALENAGEPYRANANASIRSGPGTNHGRVGRIEDGNVILVISEAPENPDWLIVRLQDADVELFDESVERGYIYGTLLDKL